MITRAKAPALNRSHIAIDNEMEVKYWSKHLGISAEELQNTVEKVGNSAAAVRKELAKNAAGKIGP
jgi:Protein of unknown function (DUF3606)